MKLIAGLGNPGEKYNNTKHNTGFMALDHYLTNNRLTLEKEKFEGFWTKQKINDEDVILIEPQTYMNDSGKSIAQIANFFKISSENILVIHDDLDMPIGKIRIRKGGKSGGHNGIKSIAACLGTNDFNRLKLGIAHPKQQTVVSWVLTPFNDEQEKLMNTAFSTTESIINDFIGGKNTQYLMNNYN